MSVRVCQSIGTAGGLDRLAAAPAERLPDLVELRLDLLGLGAGDDTAVRDLIARQPVPVLATCRPAWEGGAYSGSESARRLLLQSALAAGAGMVDVEIAAHWAAEFVARHREVTLLSHHWQEPVCASPDEMVGRMLELRPAIAKLVAPASAPAAAVPLLRAGRRLAAAGIEGACFCLGDDGRASRLLAAAAGDALIYAFDGAAGATASGQWPVSYLVEDLQVGRWQQGQRLFGVIGDPIDGSLSPTVFNAAFASDDRPAAYLLLPGRPAAAMLELAAQAGVEGLSVTMPYKSAVIECCAEVGRAAREMNAVNTLLLRGERWCGDNTDGAAVVAALEPCGELPGRRCAVLGAGGAGRAAAVALRDAGAEVTVLNRTAQSAQRLASTLAVRWAPLSTLQDERFEIIVQATPVGMNGTAETPIPTVWLEGREVVLDMVYRPLRTAFLVAAAERGCTTISGLEMFLQQAARQHRIWFGDNAPMDVMRRAAMRRLDTSGEVMVG